MKSPLNRIWHPFLFAAYPVLALLAHNIEETHSSAALRPLVFSLAAATILLLALRALLKDWARAAWMTTAALALFFTYGHVYDYLEGHAILGFNLGRHRLLAPLWLGMLAIVFWWVSRKGRDLRSWTAPLNLAAAFALALPLVQIGLFSVRTWQASAAPAMPASMQNLHLPANQPAPDIYYIILDGYTRDDMLKKYYQLDNNPFLEDLRTLGFYVAACSQSNYAQTSLSLASSLNYEYLEALGSQYQAGNTSRAGLSEYIRNSAVRQAFEALGYSIVAIDSGYDATRWLDADIYLSPDVVAEINDFENLLARTTAARLVSEGVAFLNLPPDWEQRDTAHRQRILFALEQLESLPQHPGPKFVFAHIVAPHWPHVFGPDGQPVHAHPDSVTGYRDQVVFINNRILPILKSLIENSNTPPVIIIQGDHGAVIEDPQRRMSILNAYFFPDGGTQTLYESISPVNSFRAVFNAHFGGALPLLPDESFYSRYDTPYEFELVPNLRPGCIQ